MGKAMMGTGEAEGEDRAIRAAEAAISNPLLEDTNMKGARGLLINITGGSDVTLFEVDQAANRIGEEVDKDANIMFGMSLDESLGGRIRVSVVATGIESAAQAAQPSLRMVQGGAPVEAVASKPAGYVPEPPATPLISKAFQGRPAEEFALREPVAAQASAGQIAATQAAAAQQRVAPPVRAAANAEPRHAEPARPASIFKSVFGFGGAAKPAPQVQPQRLEPAMEEPPARAAVRPAQIDEIGLEVPAFLRRGS
jgi:cell division protein FtsZ